MIAKFDTGIVSDAEHTERACSVSRQRWRGMLKEAGSGILTVPDPVLISSFVLTKFSGFEIIPARKGSVMDL